MQIQPAILIYCIYLKERKKKKQFYKAGYNAKAYAIPMLVQVNTNNQQKLNNKKEN